MTMVMPACEEPGCGVALDWAEYMRLSQAEFFPYVKKPATEIRHCTKHLERVLLEEHTAIEAMPCGACGGVMVRGPGKMRMVRYRGVDLLVPDDLALLYCEGCASLAVDTLDSVLIERAMWPIWKKKLGVRSSS